jgi:glutaredoxin
MKWPPLSLLVVIAVAWVASWAWRGHVAAGDGEVLTRLAKPGDIRMLSSEICGYCLAARRWMTQQGVPFSECFIERDAACARDYQAQGAIGTPTLLVRGQRVVGFDRARLLEILQKAEPSRQH